MSFPHTSFKEYWGKIRWKNGETQIVRVKDVASRIQVAAPFNQEFVKGAKELGGRWRYRSGVWSFPGYQRSKLNELLERVYGHEDKTQ